MYEWYNPWYVYIIETRCFTILTTEGKVSNEWWLAMGINADVFISRKSIWDKNKG